MVSTATSGSRAGREAGSSAAVHRAPASIGDSVRIDSATLSARAVGAIGAVAIAVAPSGYRRGGNVAVPAAHGASGATDERGATGHGSIGGTRVRAATL